MNTLPPFQVSAVTPSDPTGSYPLLRGYVPMQLGRRVLVAGIDTALAVAVSFGIQGLSRATGGVADRAGQVIMAVYAVLVLWSVLARSSRLAGFLLKATFVDVATGKPAGGKLFLKYLLQGVLGAVSFGIAPVVMFFVTCQEPLKRNWFDRKLGLMLVDYRAGRSPWSDELPSEDAAEPAPPLPVAIAPVRFQAGPVDSHPEPDPLAEIPPRAEVPRVAPPITPVTSDGGIITSVPGAPPRPEARPAPAGEPPLAVVPAFPVPALAEAPGGDATVLSDSLTDLEPAVPLAVLDDGTPLSLVPPTVLGRNPRPPGSHPDAHPFPVADQLVSKTHLLVGADEDGAWAIDLHSTNGVLVSKDPGAQPARIEAGRKVHLSAGSTLRFGGRVLEFR